MFMIPLSEDDFWPLKVVKRLYKKDDVAVVFWSQPLGQLAWHNTVKYGVEGS